MQINQVRKKVASNSPGETISFGVRLAGKLKAGDIICLEGDLGTGKTTLVKGIAKGLKINQTKVNSPTFVLMNVYDGRLPLHHFDLYRLNNSQEILDLGYEEFLYGNGVSVIEWAGKLGTLTPKDCLSIQLSAVKENERILECSPTGPRSREIIEELH